MNKSVIIIAVMFLVSVVFSGSVLAKEIQRGTVEISGGTNVSFSSTEIKPEGRTKTEIDTQAIDASVLYYFSPNVGVGMLWNYQDYETTTGTFSFEQTTTLIGPQLAINVSLNDKTSFKLKGSVFVSSTEVSDSWSKTKSDGFGWAVWGGLSYFVMESVSFNGGITYASLSTEDDFNNADTDTTNLSVGVGISVYIF